jgi:uncharacterized protein
MITAMRVKLIGALCAVALVAGMRTLPESPIANAAMRNDVVAVRLLIKQKADVNVPQGDGMTALHWAAEHGNPEIAQALLKAGAKTAAATRIGGYTPLHLASKSGNAEVVKLLLGAGSDVKAVTTTSGVTPLHLAASGGNPAVVAALIERGADVNAKEPEWGQTPVIFAAAYNRADAIKVLLSKGADPNVVTRVVELREQTTADGALTRRRNEILFPDSPQVAAARIRNGLPLLDAGGRPEGSFQKSNTPEYTPAQIQAAIEKARAEIYGGKVQGTAADAAAATQAERDAVRARDPDEPPPVAGLISSMGGLTALHHAAREGSVEAVVALLDGGAKINEKSGADWTTPLLMATVNGQFDAAMVLIQRGADPNIASEAGTTPLYATLERRWANRTRFPQPSTVDYQKTSYLEVMEALLAKGANPNARLGKHLYYMTYTGCGNANCGLETVPGATPFWRATYATDVDAMRLLVKHGADPNLPTLRPLAQAGGRGGPGGGGGGRGGRGGRGGGGADAAAAGDSTARVAGAAGAAGARAQQAGGGGGGGGGGGRAAGPDLSGLPPAQPGGPAVFPIHAAAGVGYGEGFAGNSHRHAPDGWLPAVKFLIEEAGVDVNLRDENGYTALHHAAARGDNELIKYLVSKGADVMVVSRRGQTTVDMANGPVSRITPYPETIKLLESLGAKNNHKCASC